MESLTRPFFHHRRKLSNVNSTSNGLSFSGKDAYDDVLLGGHPPKSKLGASSRTVVVEDYGEIFGTGRRGSSSIPVLDLSELDKANNGSYDSRPFNRKPDYSKIFGSFAAADDDLATSVPSYEELFGGGVKKAKARAAADVVSPVKESESFNSSENNRGFSSETSDQLLDGGKQMNMSYHKSSQPSKDGSNGTTHIAELHAVPGFTYFIDEATRPQKTEHDKLFRRVKSDANHSRSSSGDLSEGKSGRRAKWKLPEKQASEGLVNGKDNSWDPFSGKYNSGEFDLKSHSAKVSTPSSSSASLNDNQRHPKRAKSLTFGLKADFLEKDSNGYFSPSSDEELDVNSAAAASAAALKKAIQDAQERIRIAKELMERKRDPVQNTKSRANGSSKVKDRDEIKYDQDMNGIRKSNTKEACKSTKTEALGICGFDQKNAKASDEVASVFTCKENLSVDREVNGEKHEEGAEVNEEQGVGMWFTQLLNNGKNKMAALASQLVDNRNAIFQPTSKHVHDAEETTQAKESLEKGTTSTVDIHAKLDALGKVPDLEENLDKSISDKHVCDTGRVTLMNEPEEKSSKAEHGFHQQDKCEKKLVCEDATCNGHFEPEMLEDGCPANELRNIVEMKKEEEKSFEVETGKKLDDVLMWQDNNSRLDKKENWRTQEDSSQQIGNEYRPKEENSTESSEKEQENFQDRDFSRNSFEGDYHQEIDHKRSMCSIDGVESHNISEEEILSEHSDQSSTRTYQCESTDIMDAGADYRTESEKIEVNLEVEESDTTKGETYASNENTRNGLFPDATNEENLNARQSDESTILGGTPEVSELNNTSNQTGRSKVIDLEEHDNQTGVAGLESREEKGCVAFEQDTEEAEQEVKEATESKMFEASCSKHVLESITQDVSESLASDDNTENFGYGRSSNEEKLLMETSLLKTTSLTTKEPAAESINGDEAPTDEEKASHCDFVDMNGQKEIEKSDEESEISIRSENRDDLVHESECDAENIKEESIASDTDFEKYVFELHTEEKGSDEKQLEQECSQLPSQTKESEEHLETDTEMKAGQGVENHAENICKTSVKEEKENRGRMQKETRGKDLAKKPEVDQREREREKDRLAVERAIREARERAFAEARERAERAAVEKATAGVRQRAMAGAREKVEKVSAGTRLSTDKATTEAKLRAERAAVERATAEARERALEKALSQKSTSETRAQVEKVVGKAPVGSRDTGLKHSFSSSDLEGTLNESAQRRKARLERHQRIMERAAKALAEKNMRDILVQREQAERNRLAETLDADIKRWASGKEGNLRALLSTLQYILGPDSGWQSISLTEIITTNAVKKAYRKATLYVHPDKLQQRGATIQQKYTCEKVFDLLKAAWNRFISEER